MGVGSRRPPLPAPTESMDETSVINSEVATNVTRATDKTSYEVPEDGSPITISTQKVTSGKQGSRPGHHRQKSQTSLLIEYFEAAKAGEKSRSRPSVRVKVTPSSQKKHRNGHDAVQITGIGKDRKPSYTRRISLGSSQEAKVAGLAPTEGTELSQVSQSSESNVSGHPVEVELMGKESEISNGKSSRGLLYAQNESNVSSMPPDSMLEGGYPTESELSRDYGPEESNVTTDKDHLSAPIGSRDRSASRDRITQRVMEKLGATKPSKPGHGRTQSYDSEGYSKERRRRSSRSQQEEEIASAAESSILSSDLASSARSYRSGAFPASRMTNNPKLLEMVEDTIRRMILPEINAIKADQQSGRRLDRAEHDSPSDFEQRVSKSNSTPNISSKPKVVLNKDGDDPGTVLSRGDSERTKSRKSSREYSDHRPSSRRSSGRKSRQSEDYDEIAEEKRRNKSKSSHAMRDGMAGGILTAAALKSHNSQDDAQARRKKRGKSHSSRSRSESVAESRGESRSRKEDIPPMPMASAINESEMTRDSIVSAATERPSSQHSSHVRTPVREVSRHSLGEATSPHSTRTPTRSPASGSRGIGMSQANQSIGGSPISNRARMAALTAAGLRDTASPGAEDDLSGTSHAEAFQEERSKRSMASPVQSVSSLKKQFEDNDPLVPQGLRPASAASRSSAGRLRSEKMSHSSLGSADSSPTTQKYASHQASRRQSGNISGDDFVTPLEKPSPGFARDGTPGTPTGESVDDWYQRQHEVNDRYRDSMATSTTNRDSYQTNPYPEDDKRFSQYTDNSYGGEASESNPEQNVKGLSAKPTYNPALGVESNVASLMDPSVLSSNMYSSEATHSTEPKQHANFADRMREMGQNDSAPVYEGSTLSENMPSQDRWAAIKGHARDLSKSDVAQSEGSPRQSPARSQRSQEEKPVMGASGLPVADDPLPEIGHYDDTKSEISTNPSIIKGPLGGDASGKDTWPYTPEPERQNKELHHAQSDSRSMRSAYSRSERLMGGAPAMAGAAAAGAALAGKRSGMQPSVEDEREGSRSLTPDMRHKGQNIDRDAAPTHSPAHFRDEGYVTDAHARSAGALTPGDDYQRYSKEDLDEYNRAMDAQSIGSLREDDPFATGGAQHQRKFSGNSHGMKSPVFDRATGKGIEGIQSQDIVALMDHLTVRDAQRNARDTEILVTLVRSAAEMRSSFDEMKRFIAEQDKLIMQNTDRDANETVQKVLSGPRPQPPSSPRTPRQESQEDVQTKRKGVLRRALKGLTGGKKADDLAKVEDMLMQILDNVEDLKQGGVPVRQQVESYTNTLDSYERMRAPPDSGYEPSGRANTASTPNQSAGHLSVTPRDQKQQFHSGYDGRRGSVNRVSTVLEGDEDEDLTPEEDQLLSRQFEGSGGMLTPTQEYYNRRGLSPNQVRTSPQNAKAFNRMPSNDWATQQAEKQRKHNSGNSSLFGAPKVSRWSKTTSSSAAPDLRNIESPNAQRNQRPLSEGSRSGSSINRYDGDHYQMDVQDRPYSSDSLATEKDRALSQADTQSMRSNGSKITRTPSPLIPSEASTMEREGYDYEGSPIQQDFNHELEDPKYQAHRNSLLLQHPQPRQGSTGRHQNTLETKAQTHNFGGGSDVSGTTSDLTQSTVSSDFDPAMWGSSGTAALARNRINQQDAVSPVNSGKSNDDDGPLVPSKPSGKSYDPEPEPEWEPEYSNSGFSKGGYYSSPFGSGHLLEPIAEVRYSLETDRGHLDSPEPQIANARAVEMRSPGRKITGPRPMGSRSPAPQSNSIPRKPVARNQGEIDS
ncbi:hypothetical protein KC354_g3757 [Hortaea werneckii]|nr:hypothetical protein KC354_g3757 [Hortaea werneckii]